MNLLVYFFFHAKILKKSVVLVIFDRQCWERQFSRKLNDCNEQYIARFLKENLFFFCKLWKIVYSDSTNNLSKNVNKICELLFLWKNIV